MRLSAYCALAATVMASYFSRPEWSSSDHILGVSKCYEYMSATSTLVLRVHE